MSFETGRILPQLNDASDPGPEAGMTPRRSAVLAERAARCAELRDRLNGLRSCAHTSVGRVLEIGSGHGHFLEAYATTHPAQFCLGIDYCAERSRRAARKQQRHTHGNLHFLRAEAWEFLDSLPHDLHFDTVFILFPDPWPKRRHRKYRLLSERFLTRLACCTAPGARLCFRTDAEAYFTDARETLEHHPDWQLDPGLGWPFEQPTVFQAKAATYQSLIAVSRSPART